MRSVARLFFGHGRFPGIYVIYTVCAESKNDSHYAEPELRSRHAFAAQSSAGSRLVGSLQNFDSASAEKTVTRISPGSDI